MYVLYVRACVLYIMYVCMYCIFVCMFVCVCLCVYILYYVCVYVLYICMCVSVCMYVCVCVCIYIYIYTHTHTHIYIYIYIYIYRHLCVLMMLLYPEPVHCTVTNCPPWSFWSSSDLDTSECDYNHCTVHCFSYKVGVLASTVAVGLQRGISKKVSPRIFSRGFENVRTFANFSGKLSKWIFREQKLAGCRRHLRKRWMYWHRKDTNVCCFAVPFHKFYKAILIWSLM